MAQTPLLTQSLRGFSEEVVRELSRLKEEPDWLLERRLAAWRTYQATPMPSLQDEDWRRTDISQIPFDQLLPYSAPPADPAAEVPEALRALTSGEANAGQLLQHDSEAVSISVSAASGKDGL